MNLKVFAKVIEDEAKEQIDLLLKQKAFSDCKVRIMPDVHAGKGCVIGFTADLGNKVIPNIVGVDIGCGMLCVELGQVNIDFERLDNIIRQYVPSGMNVHDGRKVRFDKLQELKCYRELKDTKRLERSIGTLGGGNHFIEVDADDEGNKYLIIHTGSRNLGKQVAEYYQNLAIELMQGKDELLEKKEKIIKEYKEQGRKAEIQNAIKELYKEYEARKLNIPKELCYLEGKYRDLYLHDMKICQEYASLNRMQIAKEIINNYYNQNILYGIPSQLINRFETIHNYISFEDNIVRKGAISAREGEKVLIPMNMRDGCIIAIGKGNDEWNQSAPHGAGRLMSRSKARESLKLEEYKKEMEGVYTTSVNEDTIDEAPFAYKRMEDIVDIIGDTVEIQKIIKPIYNFKASE